MLKVIASGVVTLIGLALFVLAGNIWLRKVEREVEDGVDWEDYLDGHKDG